MDSKPKIKGKGKYKELTKKYDVFIFDWDGTLTELKIFRTLDQKYGLYWLYKRLKYGKDRRAKLDGNSNKKDSKFEEFKEQFFSTFANLYLTIFKPKLHYKVVELLKTLKSKNKKIILFSNGAEWRIKREIELFNIQNLFDGLFSAQKLKVIKPNPAGLNKIIEKYHLNRDKIIYIGDMVDDIVMAKAAHVDSCAIAGGFDDEYSLKKSNPNYIFNSIEELLKNI
ncbi:MAG: HAD family hydrolase [Candidatus Micrarchaeia archaeon]